ncbi:hypothetical protein [Sphingomonas sp. 1P08PE]|uniref:hypothetical protein n=1 Tax=Sphingomonas sp. 1P08PE TaxID=554122 RepID=UPI0039A0EE86
MDKAMAIGKLEDIEHYAHKIRKDFGDSLDGLNRALINMISEVELLRFAIEEDGLL